MACVGAPDWIIEILSPRDTREKFDLYEENGVREYWIVAPGEKSVTVYLLQQDRYRVGGEYYTPGASPAPTLENLAIRHVGQQRFGCQQPARRLEQPLQPSEP